MCNIIRHICIILLSFSILCSCQDSVNEDVLEKEVSKEMQWMREICSHKYSGRKAGSVGCEQVASFIEDQLDSLGYDVFVQPFRLKDSLDLKNIYVQIEGKSDSLLVIGAHYDGAVQGANYQAADDNGSGVVTLLSICDFFSKQVQREKLYYSVVFVFWAAEEVTINAAFNGSRYFVNHFDNIGKVRYYCNLDCFARKEQDLFFYYSPSSSIVKDKLCDILQSYHTQNFQVMIKENDKSNSDHVSFLRVGVPICGWNDINTSGFIHSSEDNIGHISSEKIKAVTELTSLLIQLL